VEDPRGSRPGVGIGERELLLEIAQCPIVNACLSGPEPNPCRGVVEWQNLPTGPRWAPEPWSGHLSEAPILFLSSNPSAAAPGVPPGPYDVTAESTVDRIVGLFDGAFDEGGPHIEDGIRCVDAQGKRWSYVRFWASTKARARELLGSDPMPGLDYVITEVVHCGTRQESAVWNAQEQCVDRYLSRVLSLSPARVVVIFGALAAYAMREQLDQAARYGLHGPVRLADTDRWLLKLPHPNSRGVPKTVAAYVEAPDLAGLRAALQS
jgi:hypothetical protein